MLSVVVISSIELSMYISHNVFYLSSIHLYVYLSIYMCMCVCLSLYMYVSQCIRRPIDHQGM